MNKRMKKKSNTYRRLSNKEKLKNQRIKLHEMFEEQNVYENRISHLEATVIAKENVIQKQNVDTKKLTVSTAKTINELTDRNNNLKELAELHKKDAIAANQAYEDTEKELQDLMGMYAECKGQVLYWKQAYQDINKELDQERAKPWWKKVCRV